jgi:hypothetical protein
MTEAEVGVAQTAPQGEYTRLLELLAKGATEEVDRMTSEMIAETADWLVMNNPQADRGARVVRFCWLDRIAVARGAREADQIGQRWSEAFGKVRPGAEAKTHYELKWEIAAERKAQAVQAVKSREATMAEPVAELKAAAKFRPEVEAQRKGSWREGPLMLFFHRAHNLLVWHNRSRRLPPSRRASLIVL